MKDKPSRERVARNEASNAPAALAGLVQPEVIADFVFERGMLQVAVANISEVPAYEVSVRFEPAFHGLGGGCEVSALRLFKRIRFLAPHKRIETFLDRSTDYFRRREPVLIKASISFADVRRRSYQRCIMHDLSIYRDLAYLVEPGEVMSSVISPGSTTGRPSGGEQSYGNIKRQTLRKL
jgi:hypothetical protein